MHILLQDLTRELQTMVTLQSYNISAAQSISGFQMFPARYIPGKTKLNEDTAYVCEYRQLKQLDLMDQVPPLICVVEQTTDADVTIFQGRSVVVIYGSTIVDVLVLMSNAIYESACKASHVTELTQRLMQCGSIEELMDTGFQLLQNPLVVTDRDQKIILGTPEDQVSSTSYLYVLHSEYLPVGHPYQMRTHPGEVHASDQIYDIGDEDTLPTVICNPLTVGGQTVGYLHVLAFIHDFTPEDRQIIQLLGNLLAFELYRHVGAQQAAPAQEVTRFFRDILDNIAGSSEQIMTRQRELKLHLNQFLYVMSIFPKTTDFSAHIDFYELTQTLEWMFPGCHSFLYKDGIFTILSSKEEIMDMEEYLAALLPLLQQHKLMAGISNPFSVIHQLRPYGFQARKAVHFGSVMDKDACIYQFSDYVMTYIAEICLNSSDVETLCPPGLIRLIMHAQENGTELLDTLRVYLKCGRSKAETAKQMYVHVNTVKYRISQIQSITGLDIGDDNTAFHLMMAYKMFEYKDFFSSYQAMPL